MVDLLLRGGSLAPGLVATRFPESVRSPDEAAIVRTVAVAFEDVDYVFFRRFSDGRSSQPAAFVVDNSNERLTEADLAKLHGKLWLHGVAPLLYVAWSTRVDLLSCARGPDFWHGDEQVYSPADSIAIAGDVDTALKSRSRLSARRLADGTFWDEPQSFGIVDSAKAAHRSLIKAIVETDQFLEGERFPVRRRLLLLFVLVKYLEDRRVFPADWFGRFEPEAMSFFEVLSRGRPAQVNQLLRELEGRFNGDVFVLPHEAHETLTGQELRHFADLVEARTLSRQRYLWHPFSFEHLPVEVISNLYQRFVTGKGKVYTPPFLAALLLDRALPYDDLRGDERILDPSCGSGVFLVGAFRRLVNVWRSQNDWQRPSVDILKEILSRSIFGIDLDSGAIDLAVFSLSLAICDALKPDVIWNTLRFDPLRSSNLLVEDFASHVFATSDDDTNPGSRLGRFDVVVGNPPFESRLETEASQRLDSEARGERGPLPDKQIAYLFLEQSFHFLKPGGRLCLLQPSGILHNRKVVDFRRHLLTKHRFVAVLDFTSIRGLYDHADPKTVALFAELQAPTLDNRIEHLTFRRTFSSSQGLGFELDHYDRHLIPQRIAEEDALVWRINLLGGGRLTEISARLRSFPTVADFVTKSNWQSGEGFIVGTVEGRDEADFLTGKPFLPTDALGSDGIDEARIQVQRETHFQRPRTRDLFESPLVLIRKHESLPIAFWDKGYLTYQSSIVGIHAPLADQVALLRFFKTFCSRVERYRLCVALHSSRYLVVKATANLKADIEDLPYPERDQQLDFTFWEQALEDDVLEHMVTYVRHGQNSDLLRKAADVATMDRYSDMFCRLLGSVYENLNAAAPTFLQGVVLQPFYFGDAPKVGLEAESLLETFEELLYDRHLETLTTVRVVRLYERNVLLIVKPDRLRYWIRSTAIRDADDTLVDLRRQGY